MTNQRRKVNIVVVPGGAGARFSHPGPRVLRATIIPWSRGMAGCRRPRFVVAAAVALAALAGCFFATHIEYFTQRSDLISSRKECQQRWFRFLDEFGDDDDLVVVVQGADAAAMRQALEALADGVR